MQCRIMTEAEQARLRGKGDLPHGALRLRHIRVVRRKADYKRLPRIDDTHIIGDAVILARLVRNIHLAPQVAGDLMVDLLLKQRILDAFGNRLIHERMTVNTLEQAAHLPRDDLVLLALRTCGAVKQQPLNVRFFKADLPEFPVERFDAEMPHDHIGRHVVADGDHQAAERLEAHGRLVLEEPQRAAGRHALFIVRNEPVFPGCLSFCNKLCNHGEHGQLDDACRLDCSPPSAYVLHSIRLRASLAGQDCANSLYHTRRITACRKRSLKKNLLRAPPDPRRIYNLFS